MIDKFSVNYFFIPWHFLSAPLFYTFLVYHLDIRDKFLKILRIAIPSFVLMNLTQLAFVYYFTDKGSSDELNYLFEKYRSFEEVFSFISSITIFSYCLYIINRKKKLFTNVLIFDNLKWIHNFFKLMIFVYLFWVVALIVKFKLNFDGFIVSYYPLRIFTTIVIYILGYQGLKQLRIFKERRQIRENIIQKKAIVAEPEPVKLIKPEVPVKKIESQRSEKQFKEIDTHIRGNKKFLQPKYTLQNLAVDIGIGTSTLSGIINNNAHKSFIDYINEMRVEQAKTLLIDEQYSNYTIVSIGLESGFNSKSAFYNAFKKHAGCTPLVYKNSKKL